MKAALIIFFALLALGCSVPEQGETKFIRADGAVQCKAKTAAGVRCKRYTKDSSGYCWQHKAIYCEKKQSPY